MLTIRAELWPFGDEESARRLVTINLANMGRGGSGYDYVWTIDEPDTLHGPPIKAHGLIRDYDRKAPCVNILAAILDDYRNPAVTEIGEYYLEVIDRLRNKTI